MKAQHPVTVVITFVLLVLVIMISIAITLVVRNTYSDLSTDVPCVTQIIAQAAAVRTTGGMVAPTITCPTKRVAVQTTDEDAAKEAVAHEMARCWAMWRQGTIQLFGSNEELYCHVCSVVNVSGVAQLNDFPKYLDSHDAIKGKTYSSYLAGVKSGDYFMDKDLPANAPRNIPTDKEIAVVFYYAKGQEWYDALFNKVYGQPGYGAAAGGVAAGVIVASGGAGIIPIAGAVLAGATTGGVTSLKLRKDLSYATIVAARPLSDFQSLGCTYAPVANAQS